MLLGVVAAVAVVLTVQLRSIVLDTARVQADQIGSEISRQVRGTSALNAIGDTLGPYDALTLPGNLDRYSSPTTYVEIDNAQGYPIGKSSNMGGATFDRSPDPRPSTVVDSDEHTRLGEVLVRDELVQYPGVALIVKVGEGVQLYDEMLDRVSGLLALVLVLAAIVVLAGSFALASSAIEPINRLIAAMRGIGSEQLHRRLNWPKSRHDELGTLAQTFDAMLGRLEEAFARERQFISDASHELKTPLTIINANAQMLERWADRDPKLRAESLHAIASESASLARMVNGMLVLAKAESGDAIPREPVEFGAIVEEAARLAEPRAAELGLTLRFERHSEGPLVVLGDANLLRQLFTNLIDNAIKFTERGKIELELSRSDGRAVVEISDTGIGIDDDSLERVFDRFYRTDKSRNRQVPGTGLGLAIVRSIVRVHDGSVAARRNAAGGALFRVTLPLLEG